MKQGRAGSNTRDWKTEPNPHAVRPKYAAQLGGAYGTTEEGKTDAVTMHEGRGYKAPMAGTTIHHSGSQGKHR